MAATEKPDEKKEELAPAFLEMAGTEMVDLYVGPEKKLFRVHKAILSNKVPYFNTMFNGGFKEATDNTATLPDDNPEAIDLLIGWLYSDKIRKLTSLSPPAALGSSTCSWVAFYALAEKLCLPNLADRIMDMIRDYHHSSNSLYSLIEMKSIYELTQAGSPLRSYLCRGAFYTFMVFREHQSAETWKTSAFYSALAGCEDLGKDFLDLIREYPVSKERAADPRALPNCEFHCHPKHVDCPIKEENILPKPGSPYLTW